MHHKLTINLISLVCFLFLPCTAFAGFQVQKKVQDFVIDGTNFEQLMAQIEQHAPQTQIPEHRGKWHGWMVNWDYHFRVTSISCAIENFNIHVTTEVPNAIWKGYNQAPDDLKKLWDQYQYRITQYQQSHIDLAIETGKEVEKQLIKSGSSANCPLLTNEENRKTEHIIEKFKKKHQKYDEQTNYGATILSDNKSTTN